MRGFFGPSFKFPPPHVGSVDAARLFFFRRFTPLFDDQPPGKREQPPPPLFFFFFPPQWRQDQTSPSIPPYRAPHTFKRVVPPLRSFGTCLPLPNFFLPICFARSSVGFVELSQARHFAVQHYFDESRSHFSPESLFRAPPAVGECALSKRINSKHIIAGPCRHLHQTVSKPFGLSRHFETSRRTSRD